MRRSGRKTYLREVDRKRGRSGRSEGGRAGLTTKVELVWAGVLHPYEVVGTIFGPSLEQQTQDKLQYSCVLEGIQGSGRTEVRFSRGEVKVEVR